MKSHVKLFALLLATFMMLSVLSACGTSWQKPTGLEKTENELQEMSDDEQSEEEQEPVGTEVTELQEDEDANQLEDVKLEQEKPAVVIEKAKETPTNKIEQKKNNATPSEQPKSKPVESQNVVNKQPSQPAAGDKKPVVTTPPETPPAIQPAEKEEQPEPKLDTIVYSIVISSTEIPLSATEMEITEGDTVLKALIAITKEKKIQMDYRGGQGGTAYIEGIDNVYEFDRGQGSGWMYRVNGIFPDRGAGVVSLMAGDRVEWIYTTNLGVDIGADLQPFRR